MAYFIEVDVVALGAKTNNISFFPIQKRYCSSKFDNDKFIFARFYIGLLFILFSTFGLCFGVSPFSQSGSNNPSPDEKQMCFVVDFDGSPENTF